MTSNQVKWRYSLCNEMFEDWPLHKIAETAAGIGYHGVELAPYTLATVVTDIPAAERRQMRRDVEAAGIKVAGLHWLLANTDFLLNTPDRDQREAAAGYLLDLIDFCADVGGDILVFGSPAQRDPAGGYPKDEAWKWTTQAMYRCGERALERGVVFCIEPLFGTEIISGVDDAARLVKEVDHPGFKMMVDTKSMGGDARWPVSEQIKSVWPLFKHVHVNDPNLLGPGMGDLDFVPILATLRELGYEGWLSLEVFKFELGPERIARESLAYVQESLAASA